MPDVVAMDVEDDRNFLDRAIEAATQDPDLIDVDINHEGQPDLPPTVPRAYQQEILEEACKRNIIAVLPTGVGKTLIGALLIKEMVAEMTRLDQKKLAVFLVPSVPLVYQQSDFIRTETKLNVKNFCGEMGVDFWDRDQWLKELDIGRTDVIVCTPQIFYNCLAHAYLFMDQCSLLIIDECHHARKKHPLNTTLLHFYHSVGKGRDRPKILGLTASPIWNPVNPLKSLEELESNLQASVIAVKCNLEELEFFSSKPVEKVEYYHDNQIPEAGGLHDALIEMGFRGTADTPWDSIAVKADVSRKVLGPAGIDYFLGQLYDKPIEMIIRAASNLPDTSDRQLSIIKQAHRAIKQTEASLPTSLSVSALPNKICKLVQILIQYRESALAPLNTDAGFQCIIFVVQRHIAFGLSWMLERVEDLKSWLKVKTLVGHGSRKCLEGQSQDFKQQQETVKEFKDGKYNVLISTAVGEEGLDFPACDLVIRFDPLQTMIGYVQSRGRARHQKSKFILMLNQDQPVEIENYKRFTASEPALNQVYRDDRGEAPAYDMDNAHISAYDQALRETFTVTETGAVLTYEGAVPLVEQTCSLLPHAMGVPPPRPTYEGTTTMSDGNPCYFIANLRLPPAVPLPKTELSFYGTPRTSKAEAKRAVAFEAAKTLWKYKLLNEHLLPHREKKGDHAEDGAGRQLGEDLPLEFEVEVQFTWGDIWDKDAKLFLHRIAIDGLTTVGIVAAREISVGNLPFHLWVGRDDQEESVAVSVSSGVALRPLIGSTPSETLEALERYSETVMTRVIRPNYILEGKMACLFAPLTPKGNLDAELIRCLSEGNAVTPWTSSDAFRHLAFDSFGRQIQIECVRPNLTPKSIPIPVLQPNGEVLCREQGFATYEEFAYKKLSYMAGSYQLLESDDQTMLQVVSLRRRRNNLVSQQHAILADGIHGRTKGHPQGQRFILPRKLVRLSTVPLSVRESLMLLPSIMRYMTDYDRLQHPSIDIGTDQVDLARLHEALSPPAAVYGHDYQRLETLGDRVLQLATTVFLYQEYPFKHEGLLSPLRAHSVCNRFLRNKAHVAGLGSIMCMEAVMIAKWSPPYAHEVKTRTVKRKWMQDCLEALLGAAYLSGGFPTALKIGEAVGLCFGSIQPWQERPGAMPLDTNQRIGLDLARLEEKLGYSFNYPQLLLSSVTHPSYCTSDISPYQRLEFLGDAVLDFVVMSQLFHAFPKADSGMLSWLKMVFVCNASLGYLSVRILKLHQHLLYESSALRNTIHLHVQEIEGIDLDKMVEELWDYHPPKLFADIFEAVCGAIFIDCGYNVGIVTEILGPILAPFFASVKHANQIDPISTLIRWAVRVYKCQKVRFVRTDGTEAESNARHTYKVLVHDEIIAMAGADHAHAAKCKGSQIAFEILRRDGRMSEICDCRPVDTDIEDLEHRVDDADEGDLMEAELQRVFELK